ncbi:MAG: M20/M25/M40 family metallo-hydrolase [Clostridiales bacterium]|nr:M20/M25/M40 family metallo-hydrolase [Clostridiales bacterium]
MDKRTQTYISLLEQLIATPSISRDEAATATILEQFLSSHGVGEIKRIGNNIIAYRTDYDMSRPTLMLNSHHDTVRPNKGYTRDPFTPSIEAGRLYGLGSNDAGASLVSLMAAFIETQLLKLPFNIVLALSAEEECSGANGMKRIVNEIDCIDMAIVGEPTSLQCAIGERGLLVLDCVTTGESGHAARNTGVNALYKAVDDINKLRSLKFDRQSATLGDITLNVTMIEAGSQHNVIPDECKYVVDVRTTDAYTNLETLQIIRDTVTAEVTPRSTHLSASAIDSSHPLVQTIDRLGITKVLSPTMSDMALMPFPSIKIGPGDSCRSHTADEYVMIDDIRRAIDLYINIIKSIKI